MFDRMSFHKQPHTLDAPDARARSSVTGWDVVKALSLLGNNFPPGGLRGRVATLLLFDRLSAAAQGAPDPVVGSSSTH